MDIQQCILSLLETHDVLRDTRNVNLPEGYPSEATQEGQLVIQGVLNSLLSKEVSTPLFCLT